MDLKYNKETEELIIKKLTEKKALLNCPRCGNPHFGLVGGFSILPLQENSSGLVIGGKGVPIVTTFCKNCGFLSQHAIGALGILDSNNSGPEGNK